MKKKLRIIIPVIIALILLVPMPMHAKDGGTVAYNAVLTALPSVIQCGMRAERRTAPSDILSELR